METGSDTGDSLVREAIPSQAFLPDRYRFPDGESLEGDLSQDGDSVLLKGNLSKTDSPERESRPG